jgi:protoporphyrinogen oxidase
MHVVIIGAGLTGLTAARDLLKEGNTVTILEASDRIGGLASGYSLNGTSIEPAYHHLFKTDTDIIELTEELGIGKALEWHDSSIGLWYQNRMYPFMTPFDLLFRFSPLHLIQKIRLGLTVLYLQKKKNWRSLYSQTAAAWMKKMSGKKAYQVIWEPLLKGKFQEYSERVSMAWLWARLHIRANSKEKGDAVEQLGYYAGGFHRLIDALADDITGRGGKIVTNTAVSRILSDTSVRVETADGVIEADTIVATIPSRIFADCIEGQVDSQYTIQLKSIEYIGAMTMVFTSKQSLSGYYWMNINDVDSPFLVAIQHTNLIDKSEYGGLHVYYLGTYIPHDHPFFSMSDNEIEQIFFDQCRVVFPDFDLSAVQQKDIFRFRYAQHIVDTAYEERIPDYKTPLKNVYLANFSQIFPEDRGTNYAVREGRDIAKRILKEESQE